MEERLQDTSKKATELYFRRLAEMTPAERLALGGALCQAGDSLQRSGLRSRYPEADEREICFRLAVTRFGEALARKAYGRK